MKSANITTALAPHGRHLPASPVDLQRISLAVTDALNSVENAKQKCMIAGHMLNEAKVSLGHGEFLPWLEKYVPDISYETASRWMRASQNIAKALTDYYIPGGEVIDVEAISSILTTPDADLSAEDRKYKQAWLDFTADKTIKQCLDGVCVEGDDAHRVDRAVNGKTKGGAGQTDRKDFPLFIAVKLKDIAAHLAHFKAMTPGQQAEVMGILRAAILGDEVRLSRGQRGRLFKFGTWPEEFSRVAGDTIKERLKGGR